MATAGRRPSPDWSVRARVELHLPAHSRAGAGFVAAVLRIVRHAVHDREVVVGLIYAALRQVEPYEQVARRALRSSDLSMNSRRD
jgi:hypothetical protein